MQQRNGSAQNNRKSRLPAVIVIGLVALLVWFATRGREDASDPGPAGYIARRQKQMVREMEKRKQGSHQRPARLDRVRFRACGKELQELAAFWMSSVYRLDEISCPALLPLDALTRAKHFYEKGYTHYLEDAKMVKCHSHAHWQRKCVVPTSVYEKLQCPKEYNLGYKEKIIEDRRQWIADRLTELSEKKAFSWRSAGEKQQFSFEMKFLKQSMQVPETPCLMDQMDKSGHATSRRHR